MADPAWSRQGASGKSCRNIQGSDKIDKRQELPCAGLRQGKKRPLCDQGPGKRSSRLLSGGTANFDGARGGAGGSLDAGIGDAGNLACRLVRVLECRVGR